MAAWRDHVAAMVHVHIHMICSSLRLIVTETSHLSRPQSWLIVFYLLVMLVLASVALATYVAIS